MENSNQAAFPFTWEDSEGRTNGETGLTKREYFAAKAMQGLLSNPEWMTTHGGSKYLMQKEIVAEVAVKISDALLSELSLTNPLQP